MKTTKFYTLLACLFMAITGIQAPTLPGRDIVQKAKDRPDGDTRYSENAFKLVNNNGNTCERKAISYSMDVEPSKKDYKTLMLFQYPGDLTGQDNHLGVTIETDIIKQKLPENNGGYKALNADEKKFGKYDDRIYTDLCSDNPINLPRDQLMNNYAGRIPLINSGGASGNKAMTGAIRTAVINKRVGGSRLILGRKAFQKPFDERVSIIEAVQSVYLDPTITVA